MVRLTQYLVASVAFTAVSALPVQHQKRIAQTIADSTTKWVAACQKAGGADQCGTLSLAAFQTLLAAGKNCDQQDAADNLMDLSKKLNSQDMITQAQLFAQQPRNAPDSLQVPYCQKAPRNQELNGLFHCQFAGSDFTKFSGDQTGNLPLGVTAVNPPGSCAARSSPVPDGQQISDLVTSAGTPAAGDPASSNSTTAASSTATASGDKGVDDVSSGSAADGSDDGSSASATADSSDADATSSDDAASATATADPAASATDSSDAASATDSSDSADATSTGDAAAATTDAASTTDSADAASATDTDSADATDSDSADATDSGDATSTGDADATSTGDAAAATTDAASTTDSADAASATDSDSADATGTDSADATSTDSADATSTGDADATSTGDAADPTQTADATDSAAASATDSAATATATAGTGAAPAGSKSFTLQNGKDAQALNEKFASLTASSSCTTGEQACVGGAFAQCVGGKFVSTPCGGGAQCAALPLVNSPGTSITCSNPDETAQRIADTGAKGGVTGL